jgi:hypothetical protein
VEVKQLGGLFADQQIIPVDHIMKKGEQMRKTTPSGEHGVWKRPRTHAKTDLIATC